MYEDYIRQRIEKLRIESNLSEYQLSLNLGYSQGYIQSITSGRALPSMKAFLEICDYFNITPLEFFDPSFKNPTLMHNVIDDIKKLSESDLLLLATVLKRFISQDNQNNE